MDRACARISLPLHGTVLLFPPSNCRFISAQWCSQSWRNLSSLESLLIRFQRSKEKKSMAYSHSVEAVLLLTRPGHSWGDVEQRRCTCGAGLHWKPVVAQAEKKP
ncbi:hypothetical protein V6Z12_A11G374800 [Gossypium hirsutum]